MRCNETQVQSRDSRGLLVVSLVAVLVLLAGQALAGGTWFKGELGYNGLAMDDVNESEFYFFEYTEGFDMEDVGGGFMMGLHLGYDLDPKWGIGFSWDRQWAGTKGYDQDVEGQLDLDANFWMTRVYWTPVRNDRFALGLAAGLGPFFADGHVKITEGSVNYGQDETSGNDWATDAVVTVDYRLGRLTALQLSIGYRWAKMDEFKLASAPVTKDDGTNMTLDYTGYTVKLGWKAWFGWEGDTGHPNID